VNHTVAKVALVAAALGMSGCSLFRSAPTAEPAQPVQDMRSDDLPAPLTVPGVRTDNASAGMLPPSCTEAEIAELTRRLGSQATLAGTRTFYFSTNSSDLAQAANANLAAHATLLKIVPTLKLQVVGHTDERGTHDYNLSLGERRANAVAKYLLSQGVTADQVIATSMGKEKPAVDGHDEAAWSKNRRVEMDFRNCRGQ